MINETEIDYQKLLPIALRFYDFMHRGPGNWRHHTVQNRVSFHERSAEVKERYFDLARLYFQLRAEEEAKCE